MRETSLSSKVGDALLLLHAGGLLTLGVKGGKIRGRVIIEQVDIAMGESPYQDFTPPRETDDEAVGSKPKCLARPA